MDQSPTSDVGMSSNDNPHIRDTSKHRSRYSSEEMDYEPSPSYSQRLLTAPPAHHSKIERHVSEPAPRTSPTSPPLSSVSMHLLPLPHQSGKHFTGHDRHLQPNHGPILTKQYSDSQFSYHHQQHPHLSLHRQLSLPTDHTPPPLTSTPPAVSFSTQSTSR